MSTISHLFAAYVGEYELVQGLIVLICVGVATLWPTALSGSFARLERGLAAIAGRPRLSMVLVGTLAVLARVMVLPIAGIPLPVINDETSLWLQAQTYLAGHLANGPLSPDFEAVYVLTSPVYMSMYPVLRALPLAAAGAFGLPFWVGVLATMACLAMATYWALRAWIAAPYALVGALVVIVRYGLFSAMINSYLGSAFTALGGVLVLGAYRRLIDRRRLTDGLILGVGMFILITTRPFEGVVFSTPFALGVIYHGIRATGPDRRRIVLAGMAASAAVASGLALTAAHDFAAAGDWRVQPTSLYRRTVATTPAFLFQAPSAAHARYDVTQVYLQAENSQWITAREARGLITTQVTRLSNKWRFYIGFAFTIPFGLGMIVLARERVLWFALGGLIAALTTVSWGLAHYAMPAFGVFVLVTMAGLQQLRRSRPGGRPAGLTLSRLFPLSIVIGLVVPFSLAVLGSSGGPFYAEGSVDTACCILSASSIHARVGDRLLAVPGRHLVVVDTSARARRRGDIGYKETLVYNDADVAASRIIWINNDPSLNPATLRRYPGRSIWRLDWRDDGSPWLHPYEIPRGARGGAGALGVAGTSD